MHNSLTIKNLSIAVEALSHCQCSCRYDVEELLQREIQKAKEEDEAPKTTADDKIPF
jgi:hypothetical protein